MREVEEIRWFYLRFGRRALLDQGISLAVARETAWRTFRINCLPRHLTIREEDAYRECFFRDWCGSLR